MTVLREQATQLDLKHGRYKEAARLNEAAGAEVKSLLLKMELRTKVSALFSFEYSWPTAHRRSSRIQCLNMQTNS